MADAKATCRRDRLAELAVVALVLIALLLGLALRQQVMFETVPFEAGTISGECPARWVRRTGEDPLLRVEDPLGGLFNTVIELRAVPLAEEAELELALTTLGLDRAREVSSYQSLGTETVALGGDTAVQHRFVYVHDDPDPYLHRPPVVVQGADLATRDGGRVVIATLLAAEDEFDEQWPRLVDLVESLQY
jgi:hypothetical protein